VNARPHLGHAYTTVVADVLNRFHKMCGEETYFLTGTDEHGDKVVQAAKDEGMSPLAYADQISGLFKAMWPELDIEHDYFIRTTDAAHIKVVKEVLQQIYDSGDIYFSEYEGAYCFGCERFYTERELVDGRCPDHKTIPEVISESNYFFRMSKYQQWLIDYIHTNPDFIRPERYKNEVLAFLREPLDDLCISRPKSRLQWGITLPFDDNYVTYVWFDALINYISAVGYPDGELFEKLWPGVSHLVAKDILKPHGIYWPIMLRAAGIPLYRHLNVHGYWNVDEAKMSKSLGNVVDPLELKGVYGADAFRYFLMREMVFGLDSNFNEEAFIQRYNSDLANDLGNLFSRSLTMVHKYFKGAVPQAIPGTESGLDSDLVANSEKALQDYHEAMEQYAFHKALMAIWEFINHINKYIDVTAPWELAKRDELHEELQTVLYNIVEGIRIIAGLIYPIMPRTAIIMQEHLAMPSPESFQTLADLSVWGKTTPGTQLPKTVTLFPRIEQNNNQPTDRKAGPSKEVSISEIAEISLKDFQEMDLRVATVIDAEPVPRSKKLLKLKVDVGKVQTVVAGIAETYDPEDVIGKQIIVVANIKPAKLMGVLSHGMVLTASNKGTCRLVTVDGPVEPGTRLT
jgi:methionyl-tRNA synthetase